MAGTMQKMNRRDQILTEATTLFAAGGYEGTAIRVIARSCGITEAAIYRHFDNKAHLYEEVILAKARQHDIAARLAAAAPADTIEDVLRTVAQQIIALGTGDPELLRLMFNNSLESNTLAATLFREIRLPFIAYVAREIEERIAAGELRAVDPLITARCFVGMVMDCALNVGVWEKIDDLRFQADDVVCNNVPIFARGLRSEVSY